MCMSTKYEVSMFNFVARGGVHTPPTTTPMMMPMTPTMPIHDGQSMIVWVLWLISQMSQKSNKCDK